MPDIDFTQLIEKAKEGDSAAAQRLFRDYREALMRAIRTQLGQKLRRKMESG